MRMAAIGLAFLCLQGNASALEAEQAKAFLQGAWRAVSESWIFEGDTWRQFNGGVTTNTTFTVEPLPLEMFVVVSGETGRRYVVHASQQFQNMTWFAEGDTRQLGHYTRVSD